MIQAEFAFEKGKLRGFSVKGHAGFSEAPKDIVCASVSSMTNLVANTLTEVFGLECEISTDEKIPLVSLLLKSEDAEGKGSGVIGGFLLELSEMEKRYPKYISVKKIEK